MEIIEQTLAVATEHHKAGRTAEAERLYREVLDADPRQPDALHLLGVLALQGGRADDAVDLIGRAVAADGGAALFHANLGHALHAAGRQREAAESFGRGLAILCNAGEEYGNIAALAQMVRRYDPETRAAAAAVVDAGYGLGDVMRRRSLLFHLSGDLRHYQDLTRAILREPQRFTVPSLHYAYWGMAMQMFQGEVRSGDVGGFVIGDFRRLYDLLVEETALRYGIAARLRPAGARPEVKRIALVTNQMLGEDHRPTADAFDVARRLQDDFGRELLIVNANAMAATGENGFVPEFTYNVTEDYTGVQTIEARGAKVRMASFPAKRFDSDKVQAIVDQVERFDPDAIVAFGASNVIADLFADTRAVVCLPTSSGLPNSHARIVLGHAEADGTEGWTESLKARFRPFDAEADGAAARLLDYCREAQR